METIFLLEDDISLAKGIKMALDSENIKVELCHTVSDAVETLKRKQFSLLLIDINLHDGSGIDILREQKQVHPHVPAVLLTANDMEIDIVSGLESGADDYITKPFSLAVLRARINARLRANQKVGESFEAGPYSFDFAKMIFRKRGKPVELSRTEQRLLKLLTENAGHAVTRGELVDRIWTDGAEYVDENALTVTVRRLRSKLEDEPSSPVFLRTVYGIGYMWAVAK